MSSNPEDLSTEARIRTAAVELFGSQGFAHTTVRQIAERAGVSAGLVMHHFGSKDRLRTACDDWAMEALMQEKSFLSPGALPAMEDYLAQHPEYRPLLAYLVAGLRAGGPTADRIWERLLHTSTELVDQAEQAGVMRLPADRQAAIAYLVASSCGMLLMADQFARSLGGTSLTDPQIVARYSLATTELLSDGVFTPAYRDALRASITTTEGNQQ